MMKWKLALPLALVVLALGCLALGLISGDAQRVWQKASLLCLECVGFG